MSYAVLFPGQGSQKVGMGADLFDARPDLLGDRADDILGWSLRDMCLDGPEEALIRTEHAQPALFALSYALWEQFSKSISVSPSGSAGHSLGEYSALTAARALTFDDGLALVAERGLAMAAAADIEPSGMAALIGADEELARSIVAANHDQGGSIAIANINAPGQVVVAGSADDIDWVKTNAREHGVRRAIPLKVAGAFHTAFMEPARTRVLKALASVTISDPIFPVWSNTTASKHGASAIAETLAAQMVSPVRFSDILLSMAEEGISTFVHVGPGDVTAGMARKTVEGSDVLTVNGLDDVDEAVVTLGTMA